MRIQRYFFHRGSLTIQIAAETTAEGALLAHLRQDGHVSVVCGGPFKDSSDDSVKCGEFGLELFIRNKADWEYRKEIEDELGRKRRLERRRVSHVPKPASRGSK